MLEPLKKTRLYEEIIKQIKTLIRTGVLKPGQKLPPERELALELNVSRTAIREALRSLEMMGFIESKVGEGTYIRQVTIDNIIEPFSGILSQNKKLMVELIDVRLLLEVEISKLAARHIDQKKADTIENAIKLMEMEVEEGSIGLKGDNAFHDAIAIASENIAMSKILEMCGDLLSSNRESTLRIPGQPKKSIDDHKKIFEAIKKGDEIKAAAFMKEHLEKAHRNLEKIE